MRQLSLKETVCGIAIAIILGVVLILPAEHIMSWINNVFSLRLGYEYLEVSYVFLLILICKVVFKHINSTEKNS